MNRNQWLEEAREKINAGAPLPLRCVMATADRLQYGLCVGDIPRARANRHADTCSPECQSDKRKLKRAEAKLRKCAVCGHGYTKKQREELTTRFVSSSDKLSELIEEGTTQENL